MAKKIVITSGKGGVGKTTVSVNLGCALADAGARVVMMDIDFGLNNLDVVMGVENKVVFDMRDVFEGRCRLKQALIQDTKRKNLYILPSNSLNTQSPVTGQNVKVLCESLSGAFDYVILDCPAGIDIGFHRAVSVADEAVVVTTPTIASLRDADKVLNILSRYRMDNVGIVVNRVRGDLIMGEQMMTPFDVEELLKTKLLGILPEEDAVFLSCGRGLPKRSDSFKAYKILANNVMTGKRKIYNVTGRYSGILGSIRRSIKRSV